MKHLVLYIDRGDFVAIGKVLFLAVRIVFQVRVTEEVSIAGNIHQDFKTLEVSRGCPH